MASAVKSGTNGKKKPEEGKMVDFEHETISFPRGKGAVAFRPARARRQESKGCNPLARAWAGARPSGGGRGATKDAKGKAQSGKRKAALPGAEGSDTGWLIKCRAADCGPGVCPQGKLRVDGAKLKGGWPGFGCGGWRRRRRRGRHQSRGRRGLLPGCCHWW